MMMQQKVTKDQGYHSQRTLTRQLFDCLRKQRQITNRITALFIEKQHQLKNATAYLPRTPSPINPRTKSRPLRSTQPFTEQSNNRHSLNKTLTQGVSSSHNLNLKREELMATRQQRYNQIKRVKAVQKQTIQRQRDHQQAQKKRNHKLVKLMEVTSQENIKKYWVEKTEHLQLLKEQEMAAKTKLMNNSLHNISMLQEQERMMREGIRKVTETGDDSILSREWRVTDKTNFQDDSLILAHVNEAVDTPEETERRA